MSETLDCRRRFRSEDVDVESEEEDNALNDCELDDVFMVRGSVSLAALYSVPALVNVMNGLCLPSSRASCLSALRCIRTSAQQDTKQSRLPV